MRRIFAYIGFTYLISNMMSVVFGSLFANIGLIFFLSASVVLFLVQKKKNVIPLITIALSASLALGSFAFLYNKIESDLAGIENKDVTISGTVSDLPYNAYGKTYYTINIDSIKSKAGENVPLNGKHKARLSSAVPLDIDAYDNITVHAKLYDLESDGGLDSKAYYLSKGITIFGYIKSYSNIEVSPQGGFHPMYILTLYKSQIKDKLYTVLPQKEASLLSACIMGERYDLGSDIKDNFLKAGLYHILCVSGLHLSIISMFTLALLTRLRLNRRIAAVITMIFVVLFMLFTGMSGSVTRSGIMMLVLLFGYILRRHSDPLNSLGFAVFLICMVNPFAAGDTGLLLSFASTLGILTIAQPMNGYLSRRTEKIHFPLLRHVLSRVISIGTVSFAATIFTLPIMILTQRDVSLVGVITNILLLPVATVMIQLGFFAVMMCLVPGAGFIYMPLLLISGGLGKLLMWATWLISKIPFASVNTGYGFVALWLMLTLIMLAFGLVFVHNKYGYSMLGVLSSIILMCGIFSSQLSGDAVTADTQNTVIIQNSENDTGGD